MWLEDTHIAMLLGSPWTCGPGIAHKSVFPLFVDLLIFPYVYFIHCSLLQPLTTPSHPFSLLKTLLPISLRKEMHSEENFLQHILPEAFTWKWPRYPTLRSCYYRAVNYAPIQNKSSVTHPSRFSLPNGLVPPIILSFPYIISTVLCIISKSIQMCYYFFPS